MSKKRRWKKAAWKAHVVVGQDGDDCPRCGQPTEIREHRAITGHHLAQPFYYSRWFCCQNRHCRTTLIMPERFKVLPPPVIWDETTTWDELEGEKA